MRGGIHGVLLAVPEHAPMRPTRGQRYEEPRVGVDGFGGLQQSWAPPSLLPGHRCVRWPWDERIDQNIGMAGGPTSVASAWVKLSTPALEVPYADSVGRGNSAAREARLITRP